MPHKNFLGNSVFSIPAFVSLLLSCGSTTHHVCEPPSSSDNSNISEYVSHSGKSVVYLRDVVDHTNRYTVVYKADSRQSNKGLLSDDDFEGLVFFEKQANGSRFLDNGLSVNRAMLDSKSWKFQNGSDSTVCNSAKSSSNPNGSEYDVSCQIASGKMVTYTISTQRGILKFDDKFAGEVYLSSPCGIFYSVLNKKQ